jgi:hypothetical protein
VRNDPADITSATPPSLSHLALAAVAQRAGAASDSPSPEALHLLDHARDLPTAAEPFAALVRGALEDPCPEDAALARLAHAWNLSLAEVLSLALAVAVERDLLAGRALAYVQAPVGGSRPTLGLLSAAFGHLDGERPLSPTRLAHSTIVLSGALHLPPDGPPLPERAVAVPLPLCAALEGEDVPWPGNRSETPTSSTALPESIASRCRDQAAALLCPHPPILVLRAAAPEETLAAAAAIARALGGRSVVVDQVHPAGFAAWLLLRERVPVFIADVSPGEVRTLPSLPYHTGPILVAAGLEGTIEHPDRDVTQWTLPLPTLPERRELWREALPGTSDGNDLARSHRLGAARIAQLGNLAAHQARLEGRDSADADTVRAVSRSGAGAGLDGLAQLVTEPITDEALVMGPDLRNELDALLARCRHRDGLAARLGAAATARYTAGVRALFVGPSGTGKTLAAGWLATRLGLPLYRVDLASINSKYKGETQKNLARLLARAERTEAVLLFDEADSLFGKRTEVRDANDRFANTQTNYLLQRIESFDSIALLTSNSRTRFDAAFSRRLDVIVEFTAPGPAERRALWQAHLGGDHAVSIQEINLLASQCDFAGGQIRNVVLAAAVAARAGGQEIDLAKLLTALQGEYRKAGRTVPPALVSTVR